MIPVGKYECGHIGRTNSCDTAKVKGFIRVAEIRDVLVMPVDKACPQCRDSYITGE
jgi:hypothetical protein